ncbi:MAG: RtcB family protein, partial [Chlorobi bacterium]|nr:RtcB family protein [Chlorobiota bacterium]
NRTLIMKHLRDVFIEEFENIEFGEMINIAHNFAEIEKHYGRNVTVHRKGATKATEGLIGIIPGSQGTKSYIVEGKGNKESFNSCSHGAGRIMGRKQAQRNLDLDSVIAGLDKKGIIHSIKTKKDLDEAPEAYKNIEEVMDLQRDLVSVVTELTPLAVIKG